MSSDFKINSRSFEYFKHPYNNTWVNERKVEVPIAKYFIAKVKSNYIEVGAVMPYYGFENATIIDICDPHPKVLKLNALDYSYANKNVLSVSTVEHLQKAEYLNNKDTDCISLTLKIINESSRYLITWPLGYNIILDSWLGAAGIKYNVLRKIDNNNNWRVAETKQLSYLYDRVKGCANAICIVTNLTELL